MVILGTGFSPPIERFRLPSLDRQYDFSGRRLLGGAKSPRTPAQLRRRDQHVQIHLLSQVRPLASQSDIATELNQLTGSRPSRSSVYRWSNKADPTDRRLARQTRRIHSAATRAALIRLVVGNPRRTDINGARLGHMSIRSAVKYWNQHHPARNVSRPWVSTLLSDEGYVQRRRPYKCALTAHALQRRQTWCDLLSDTPTSEFRAVVWTDSTHINYTFTPNRHNDTIYLRRDENVPAYPKYRYHHHEHVYVALTIHGVAAPVFTDAKLRITSQIYREQILPQLVAKIQDKFDEVKDDTMWIMQADGAPAHFAKATMPVLQRLFNGDGRTFWPQFFYPPASADLSPVENFHPQMQQYCLPRGTAAPSKAVMRERIRTFCNDFSVEQAVQLVESVPQRIIDCTRNDYHWILR